MRYVLLISSIALTANIAKADWIILPDTQWCSKTDKNLDTKKLKTYKEQADALVKNAHCKSEEMFIPNARHVSCDGSGDHFFIFDKQDDCGAFLPVVTYGAFSSKMSDDYLESLKKAYKKLASQSEKK